MATLSESWTLRTMLQNAQMWSAMWSALPSLLCHTSSHTHSVVVTGVSDGLALLL